MTMDKYTSMSGEYIQFICQDEIVEGWIDTSRVKDGVLEIKLAEFAKKGGENAKKE